MRDAAREPASESGAALDAEERALRRCRKCGKLIERDEADLRADRPFCFWCAYVEPQG